MSSDDKDMDRFVDFSDLRRDDPIDDFDRESLDDPESGTYSLDPEQELRDFNFGTPTLEVMAYDAKSEDTARLVCGECLEPVEMVDQTGATCGCRDTPAKWELDRL